MDPNHILDFTVMLQIHIFDTRRERPVKRGKQGLRISRPGYEK